MSRPRPRTDLKLSVPKWHTWRAAIDVLRGPGTAHPGYSWNQISKLHGTSQRGWAAAAYEHRGLLDERYYKKGLELAEEHLAPLPSPAEEQMAKKSISNRAAEEFRSAAQRLVDDGRFLNFVELGRALGYSSPSAVSNIMRGASKPSAGKLRAIRELDAQARAGKAPEPEATPEPQAPPAPVPVVNQAAGIPDPYAWMDRISIALLSMAEEVGKEALSVPEAFRAPYAEKQGRLVELAAEFER